jgi:hypothetical protein
MEQQVCEKTNRGGEMKADIILFYNNNRYIALLRRSKVTKATK